MIKGKTISEIKEVAKVEDVVEDFVFLKKRGANMIGLCPFHSEKTPSFVVSPSKNMYKCFGCGRAGGPIQFIKEHNAFSFPEAITYLAKKYSIKVEHVECSIEETRVSQLKDSLFLVNQLAKDYFQSIETDFFTKRGLSKEVIERFGLGYSDGGLTRMATEKGYTLSVLKKIGLTDNHGRDLFINQGVFTIYDLSGRPVCFAGVIGSSKGITCPVTEIYHKDKVLYGFHIAKREIQKEDECIVVEEYMDCVTLHQVGIENVISAPIALLTIDQVRAIKRHTLNVKVVVYGDVKSVHRGISLMLEQNINVRVVVLPDGLNSHINVLGETGFKVFLKESSKDFIFFKVDEFIKEGDVTIEMVMSLIKTLKRIPDLIKRGFYIQECAKLLGIEDTVLDNEMLCIPRHKKVALSPDEDLITISKEIEKTAKEITRLSILGKEDELLQQMRVYGKLISIRGRIAKGVITLDH